MPYSETNIQGVHLFEPSVFTDTRGEFQESFRPDRCFEETGFDFRVAQINRSVSHKGVIRGIHFKKLPPGQAKFVSVDTGAIIDVVIDLRKSSDTFGRWQAFELSAENRSSLLVGYGIGHAFLSLVDDTKVTYLCDSVFQPDLEFGVNPLEAGIDWMSLAAGIPPTGLIVSAKDLAAPGIQDAKAHFFE